MHAWKRESDYGPVFADPVLDSEENRLIVSHVSGKIIALETSKGEVQWELDFGININFFFEPMRIDSTLLLQPSNQGTLFILNLVEGRIVQSIQLGESSSRLLTPSVFSHDSTAFVQVADTCAGLHVLQMENNTIKKCCKVSFLAGDSFSKPALVGTAAGKVKTVLGSRDDCVYCIEYDCTKFNNKND
ncbi:hypothetical protein Ciccas_013742 [Cichlidogyrus casuarinus]|uniref:Uncharacterized protein n=1 Tax=Cichlidogyrus casuarinus TaxID=1844966 RepID=A0ABD2PJW4_9PLAT